MPDASTLALLVMVGSGVTALAVMQRRHVAGVRRDRGSLFEECGGVLSQSRVHARGLDFPVLVGRRGSLPVRVEPVVDTLSMRTVPVLWLVTTIGLPHPVGVRLSVLARGCGTEFYARHPEAGKPLAPGPDWPDSLAARADQPGSVPADLLERVADVMADERFKQIAFSGATARVVWRCAAAAAGSYRVTRRVDLTGVRVDPVALGEVLDAVAGLAELAARRTGQTAGEAVP